MKDFNDAPESMKFPLGFSGDVEFDEDAKYGVDVDGYATILVTGDGKRCAIRKMSDSHIINAINYMRKTASASHNMACAAADEVAAHFSNGGEMAEYYADQAAEEVAATDPITWLENEPKFLGLCREADRRGLKY